MITTGERAAREVFHELPWQSQEVVREWLALGYGLRDALIRSNVLGSGEPISPWDARQEELTINDRRETAEHEAAHAVAAEALGLHVNYAKITDNGGICHFKNGTKLQSAIVTMAPEIWLTYFRRDAFPYGPTGLKSDHRALADIRDDVILRQAWDHCFELLKQNTAIVLTTADQIERYGFVMGW